MANVNADGSTMETEPGFLTSLSMSVAAQGLVSFAPPVNFATENTSIGKHQLGGERLRIKTSLRQS